MKISRISALGLVPLATLAFWTGCSASDNPDGGGNGSGGSVADSDGVAVDSDGVINPDSDQGGGGGSGYTAEEWPAEPVIDEGAPANAASLFGGAPGGAGPCVLEPQDGSMVPKNWLRPRFNLTAAGGETLFEIKLSSDKADGKTLTIYTANPAYAMKGGYFAWIANKATSEPVIINVAIRATMAAGGNVSSSSTSFIVAPVTAGGSMVYWASKASGDKIENSRLEGFRIGDEATITALIPTDVQESSLMSEPYVLKPNVDWQGEATGATPGKTSCIGCHTSTPDGTAVAFNDGWPWAGVTASIEEGSKGARAGGVSDLGARLLQMPFIGTTTFSSTVWDAGKKYAVSTRVAPVDTFPYSTGQNPNLGTAADLIWVDLAAVGDGNLGADLGTANATIESLRGTAWGKITRTGDARAAANPNWSPDGLTVAYTSAERVAGSHVGGISAGVGPTDPDLILKVPTEADIYTVPFAEGAGGPATPLAGASDPGVAEYYPDYSSDGKFLAFNRAPSTMGYIYYRADGEIYVVSSAGGAPHRLEGNTPPACTGEVSPGVINSWAKWSPNSTKVGDTTYYWLIFSSARTYVGHFPVPRDKHTPIDLDNRSSQLYLAAVAVKADGTITSYPAAYIWNQTKDTSNLTPAWDEFLIPDVPVK